MAQVAIFKKILIKLRKDLSRELFYSEWHYNVSHYIYYLATDNIHVVKTITPC